MSRYQFYNQVLIQCFIENFEILQVMPKAGGCINNAVQVITNRGDFFIKYQRNLPADMFAMEERGLELLKSAGELKVPQTYGYGKMEETNYLVMEHLDGGIKKSNYWENFGSSLAQLHQHHHDVFGLLDNNYIGKLPQKNNFKDNWIDFFIENRLEVQLNLALSNKLIDNVFAKQFRSIYQHLPGLLPREKPSLLHGDLWSGNVIVGSNGHACLIDPAVYYGNREIELAFTKLFGGFDERFYQSYQETFPLAPAFDQRVELYNLYPLMVHVNLFGHSYLNGVERIIKSLQ